MFLAVDAAIRRYPDVLSAIAGSATRSEARAAVSKLLGIDEMQATAVLDLQWTDLRADRRANFAREISDLRSTLEG